MNLAIDYLERHSETVDDWDGICGELANAILMERGDRKTDHLIYIEGDIGDWYHMAPLCEGLVHDAWCPGDGRPLRDWLIEMYGEHAWIELTLDAVDIFAGHARDFIFEPCA